MCIIFQVDISRYIYSRYLCENVSSRVLLHSVYASAVINNDSFVLHFENLDFIHFVFLGWQINKLQFLPTDNCTSLKLDAYYR